VSPWRYNRDRSYLRRPLCSHEGTDQVMFGHRNALRTSYELHGQYLSGRLKAKTPEMRAALSAARDLKGDTFEESVADELRQWCDPVRHRVRRFGHYELRNIDGRNLGDIDVVAFDSESQSLYVIEAKALAVARAPREMVNELSRLIEGERSAVERLRGRYECVRAHLPEVLQTFNIQEGTPRVRPLIVIDADLLTSRFKSPYRIVPFAALSELFISGWARVVIFIHTSVGGGLTPIGRPMWTSSRGPVNTRRSSRNMRRQPRFRCQRRPSGHSAISSSQPFRCRSRGPTK
jgi:hypothetical protein